MWWQLCQRRCKLFAPTMTKAVIKRKITEEVVAHWASLLGRNPNSKFPNFQIPDKINATKCANSYENKCGDNWKMWWPEMLVSSGITKLTKEKTWIKEKTCSSVLHTLLHFGHKVVIPSHTNFWIFQASEGIKLLQKCANKYDGNISKKQTYVSLLNCPRLKDRKPFLTN